MPRKKCIPPVIVFKEIIHLALWAKNIDLWDNFEATFQNVISDMTEMSKAKPNHAKIL